MDLLLYLEFPLLYVWPRDDGRSIFRNCSFVHDAIVLSDLSLLKDHFR
jgi:hypothetical protein